MGMSCGLLLIHEVRRQNEYTEEGVVKGNGVASKRVRLLILLESHIPFRKQETRSSRRDLCVRSCVFSLF